MSNPTPDALLPCPFCGNDGSGPIEDALHISHTQNDWHPAYDCYSVQCDKCTANMGYSASEEEAVAAWNCRAGQSHAAGLLAALEEMLHAVCHETGFAAIAAAKGANQ